MAQNDFPVATTDQNATVSNPPATQDSVSPGAAASSVDLGLGTVGADTSTDTDADKAKKGESSFTEFLKNGEVLRRLIILGFVVLFLSIAIIGVVSIQSSSTSDAYRLLGRYSPQQMGKVLDFLDVEGFNYQLQGTDGIAIDVNQYNQVRELMLRRGIGVEQMVNNNNDNALIMTDSGFGVSQRLEGERIKHSRELQLARAIERIDGVEHATVLLAIPKENVFARQQSRPSAAVVVTLKQGAYLSPENVNSIRFTVSSSVQNLLTKDVTVTDQNGRLLSAQNAATDKEQDRLQKEFELRTLREAQYRDKLDSILGPMLGYGNYTAEVDLTLDTTLEEETRQMYNPDSMSVRSETLREEKGQKEIVNPYGVPGSLSNQPPANATIPQQLKDGTANIGNGSENPKESREAVRNYELDTTIRHIVRPTNSVTRLTVSVAVDYIKQTDANGVTSYVPRPQEDLDKIADLVRGGLGLDERRGDFVSVETVSFPHTAEPPSAPWWQQESFYRIVRIAAAVLVILIIVLFVVRPLITKLLKGRNAEEDNLDSLDFDGDLALEGNDDLNLIAAQNDMADQVYSINREGGIELPNLNKGNDLLKAVRTLVSNEPQLSSEVIREWINSDSKENKKNTTV